MQLRETSKHLNYAAGAGVNNEPIGFGSVITLFLMANQCSCIYGKDRQANAHDDTYKPLPRLIGSALIIIHKEYLGVTSPWEFLITFLPIICISNSIWPMSFRLMAPNIFPNKSSPYSGARE